MFLTATKWENDELWVRKLWIQSSMLLGQQESVGWFMLKKSVERSQMYVLTFIVFYCFLLSWIILHPNLYDF